MKELLYNNSEFEIFEYLLIIFNERKILTPSDKKDLLEYTASNYELIGLIGLLTQDIPRILLGKLCWNAFIKKECKEIKHTLEDLKSIADVYLEVEHTEADEYVFQKVMLEYPRNLLDSNGNLIK